ncbi:MAG TPA: 50S ribosomal protein L18 [archaeon]|nr:50S ribosomal protein L18 [archaeon]
MLRRRREKRTDYKARLAFVKSRKPRLVVRRSLKNIRIQLISYEQDGDKSLLEVFSKNLIKYGWNYHGGSIPSAYLTGFLAGKMALSKGITIAFLDIGMQNSTRGSSLFVAAYGAKQAGLKVPVGNAILPSEDRIKGKHISDYASSLKKQDSKKYTKQFSSYLKANAEPEMLSQKFEEVKAKIEKEFGSKKEASE